MTNFNPRGLDVGLYGMRQDNPPKMVAIDDEPTVDTDESDQRHDRLHRNVRTDGVVSNMIAAAVAPDGISWRKT
jgi:hypothetical protein